jgi:WD40 repeat protein
MSGASQPSLSAQADQLTHDVFVSYSRKDAAFARQLERALESYNPPKELFPAGGGKRMRVYRDEEDFTGVAYYASIERQLRGSANLLVICSPHARASQYVDEEIQTFIRFRGADRIVPVLFSGIPNNAALPGQEAEMAFPQALCRAIEMPIAVSFAGFDTAKHTVGKGLYYGPWYATLANLYGIPREEIEQRDKRRRARTRNLVAAIIAAVIATLSVALIFALVSRRQAIEARRAADSSAEEATKQRDIAGRERVVAEANALEAQKQRIAADANAARAEEQRKLAVSRQLAAQSGLLRTDQLDLSLLLGWEAYLAAPSNEAKSAILSGLVDSGTLVSMLRAHKGGHVESIAFRADGARFATGSSNGEVVIWDFQRLKPVGRALRGPKEGVQFLSFDDSGATLLAGGKSGNLQLWELASGQSTTLPDQPGRQPAKVAAGFAADGRTIWSADASGAISVWSPNGGWRTVRPPVPEVSEIAFSRDGTRAAWCDSKGGVVLWESAGNQTRIVVRPSAATGENRCTAIALSTSGKKLSTARGGKISAWDLSSAEAREERMPETVFAGEMKFSPNEDRLAIISGDSVLVWKLGAYYSTKLASKWSAALAFRPDGNSLVAGGCEEASVLREQCSQALIRVFSLEDRVIASRRFSEHRAGITDLLFQPRRPVLASADEDGRVVVRDVVSGRDIASYQMGRHEAQSLAYNSGGDLLAAGGRGEIDIFDSTGRGQVAHITAPDADFIAALRFTRGGTKLAMAAFGDSEHGALIMTLWDVRSRRMLGAPARRRFDVPEEARTHSVEFSPDASRLAAAYLVKEIRTSGERGGAFFSVTETETHNSVIDLYDTGTGKLLRTLRGTSLLPPALAFTDDGRNLIATAVADNGTTTISILDVNTLRVHRQFSGEPVTIVDIASGDSVVAGTGLQATAMIGRTGLPLWDIKTGERISVTLPGGVTRVALQAGEWLASGDKDGGVFAWPLNPGEWRRIICRIANRNLTEAEQIKYLGRRQPLPSCPGLP